MGYSALRRKKRGKRERKMGERERLKEKRGELHFLVVPHRERKREKKRERKN